MDNDDRMVGRLLSRREALALIGAASAAVLAGCGAAQTGSTAAPSLNAEAASAVALGSDPAALATQAAEVATAEAANTAVTMPACIVRPEVTEGPYYVDADLVRSDIREDREGVPLALTFNVMQVSAGTCTPLQGATVEIWHCDVEGAYSGVSDPGFDTSGQTWLRGAQVTDANGIATFSTIYPGWYSGRAVHIHFKIHPDETKEFTSQLFFDDALSDQVFTQAPYADKGQRDMLNSTDNIYQDLLLLSTSQSSDGYTATFPIGIDLATVGTGETQNGGPGGPGGPGRPGGPRPGASSTATP